MAYARKVDGNHSEIIEALRAAGWFIKDTSALPGFVDVIAAKGRRLELVEIKRPKGKLTPAQVELHAALCEKGVIVKVLRDVQDAIRL